MYTTVGLGPATRISARQFSYRTRINKKRWFSAPSSMPAIIPLAVTTL